MTILNINSKLAWKSDFDISQAVIPFEYESIKELKNALLQVEVDPIGRINGIIPHMPTLKKQFEEAKNKQLEFPGFCVFNGIQNHLDSDLWGKAFRVFAPFMGEVIGQDLIDQIILDRISITDQKKFNINIGDYLQIKSVSYKGGDFSKRWRYSDGKDGGDMHTDGVERPPTLTPKHFGFVVRNTSRSGGKSWLVSVPQIYLRLQRSAPKLLEVLHSDFCFSLKGDKIDGKEFTSKPILFKSGEKNGFDTIGAQYLRHYIHQGHELAGKPLTEIQIKALDAFDYELVYPGNLLVSDYIKGGIYLINNYHTLHGRSSFDDHTADPKRELLRVWTRPF
jgi:hypothetical protein